MGLGKRLHQGSSQRFWVYNITPIHLFTQSYSQGPTNWRTHKTCRFPQKLWNVLSLLISLKWFSDLYTDKCFSVIWVGSRMCIIVSFCVSLNQSFSTNCIFYLGNLVFSKHTCQIVAPWTLVKPICNWVLTGQE